MTVFGRCAGEAAARSATEWGGSFSARERARRSERDATHRHLPTAARAVVPSATFEATTPVSAKSALQNFAKKTTERKSAFIPLVSRETACRATEVRRDGMTRFPDDLQATISEVVASTTGRRSEGKPSVVCVSGGRGSGKNTHARVAANAILFAQGRVAVLDGDCANPLFGAPGVLTLSVFDAPIPAVGSPACFSERWLRRRAPLAAFFVGPTCARDNPAAYAASLERGRQLAIHARETAELQRDNVIKERDEVRNRVGKG